MNQTILVVEDDEVLGRVLSRVLMQQGHTVHLAATVRQALQAAQERRPQLALLDLCLPDGDGRELAQELHSYDPDLPLILVTAYPLRLNEDPRLHERFVTILTKPLDLREIRQAVQTALALPRRSQRETVSTSQALAPVGASASLTPSVSFFCD